MYAYKCPLDKLFVYLTESHPEIKAAHLNVIIFGTELAAQIRAAVQYSLDTEAAWVQVNHWYIFDLSHMPRYCDINNLSELRTFFQEGLTLMHDSGLRDRATVCIS